MTDSGSTESLWDFCAEFGMEYCPSGVTEPSFPDTEAAGAGLDTAWSRAEGSKEQNHLPTPLGSSTPSCCF